MYKKNKNTTLVNALLIPESLPRDETLKSWGENRNSYDPEFWEFQYEAYRYLSRLSADELAERYRSIVKNMRALVTSDCHAIPIRSYLSSWYWYRKEHQTRLEFHLRDLEIPCSSPSEALDKTRINVTSRSRVTHQDGALFRFGKAQDMQKIVEHGEIRIGPARHYRTVEGDGARFDEEREKSVYIPGDYARVSTSRGQDIPIVGDIRRTIGGPDYYLLCMSYDWDRGLFEDFNVDACVVFHDAEILSERLETASMPELNDWYFYHNPVHYFDPYERLKDEMIDASMSKDFRFAYQREYRFIWAGLSGQTADGFKFINAGSLTDIAVLRQRD